MRTLDRDRFFCKGNIEWQNQRAATSYYDAYKNLENGAFDDWSINKADSIIESIDNYTIDILSNIANDVRCCLELVGVICHLNMEWERRYGKSNVMAKHYEKLHGYFHRYINDYNEAKMRNDVFRPPLLTRYKKT